VRREITWNINYLEFQYGTYLLYTYMGFRLPEWLEIQKWVLGWWPQMNNNPVDLTSRCSKKLRKRAAASVPGNTAGAGDSDLVLLPCRTKRSVEIL
jgi:hypothetical protein